MKKLICVIALFTFLSSCNTVKYKVKLPEEAKGELADQLNAFSYKEGKNIVEENGSFKITVEIKGGQMERIYIEDGGKIVDEINESVLAQINDHSGPPTLDECNKKYNTCNGTCPELLLGMDGQPTPQTLSARKACQMDCLKKLIACSTSKLNGSISVIRV